RHEPVDRIPLMLWIEPHTALKISQHVIKPKSVANRLLFDGLAALQSAMPTEELRNVVPMLSYLGSADYFIQLGTDIVEFQWFSPLSFVKDFRIEDKKLVITDVYGIERSMMGLYLEMTKHPCDTIEDLDRYRFPRMPNRQLHNSIRAFKRAHPGIAVAVDIPGIQDVSMWFMGMEKLYLWMAMHPDNMKRFQQRFLAHTLDLIRGLCKAGADIITILDDYGAQNRMLISKKMWEEFTFPCLKRQCEETHKGDGIVMLHSCGHVQPLLEGIADAGVDMLQSFQPRAGNDLAKAKEEFGNRLCFVTGIDSQSLGGMTPDEVRAAVRESVRIGGEGGGFVLATNHALQVDTPAENLKALFETLDEVR
ncbi:MAG: uroporphyrinogen decarboxylase family protein, partial [bacterium]